MAQNDEGGTSSKDYLKRIAEGSGNVDESGNFSFEVLRSALMSRFNLELPNIRQQGVGDKVEITEIEGFVSSFRLRLISLLCIVVISSNDYFLWNKFKCRFAIEKAIGSQ